MSTSYNPAIPNPPDAPSDDVGIMQTNAAAISNLIVVDHIGFNVLQAGQHKKVTFAGINVPAVPTTPPVLFTNNDAFALAQLFFYTGTNNTQYVALGSGSCALFGGIILKWGGVSWPGQNGAINYVPAFPHATFAVVVQNANSGNNPTNINVVSSSPTGFTVFSPNNPSGSNFFYIAIGN